MSMTNGFDLTDGTMALPWSPDQVILEVVIPHCNMDDVHTDNDTDDNTDDDHDDDDTDDDNDHKNDSYTAAGAAPGASTIKILF